MDMNKEFKSLNEAMSDLCASIKQSRGFKKIEAAIFYILDLILKKIGND